MYRYTFGRWQESGADAYVQIHGDGGAIVGTLDINNQFRATGILHKFNLKKFNNPTDCLDTINEISNAENG